MLARDVMDHVVIARGRGSGFPGPFPSSDDHLGHYVTDYHSFPDLYHGLQLVFFVVKIDRFDSAVELDFGVV